MNIGKYLWMVGVILAGCAKPAPPPEIDASTSTFIFAENGETTTITEYSNRMSSTASNMLDKDDSEIVWTQAVRSRTRENVNSNISKIDEIKELVAAQTKDEESSFRKAYLEKRWRLIVVTTTAFDEQTDKLEPALQHLSMDLSSNTLNVFMMHYEMKFNDDISRKRNKIIEDFLQEVYNESTTERSSQPTNTPHSSPAAGSNR